MGPDRTADVIVVGAGIIGCSIAYELARRGAGVRVLDARGVARGATQAAAGMLVPSIEGEHSDVLGRLGGRSLALFDDFIARIGSDGGGPVEYARAGTLQVAFDEEQLAHLRASSSAAVPGVRTVLVDGREARELEPHLTEDVCGGLLAEGQGFVAAGELTDALCRAATRHGVQFFAPRRIERLMPEQSGVRVETTEGHWSSASVVLAAGSWSCQIEVAGVAPLPVRPVRGQLLHLSWVGLPLTRVAWGPGCYLVPWSDGSLLVGATVEEVGFDERATVAGVRDVLDAACDLVPAIWRAGFKAVRTGLRPATPDELPIVGPSRRIPGLFYATGHFRNGILLAPLTAVLVANLLIDGAGDPSLAAMDPNRFGEF